jgi:hypothetical protein
VKFKGQPAKGALVVLHPVNDTSAEAIRPSGEVGEDGSFYLTSFQAGDGAPAGEYIVSITWMAPAPTKGLPARLGKPKEESDRLGGRYSRQLSNLRATIKPGKNSLEPFEVE